MKEEALMEPEERLRQLSASLFTAQETERKRISTELHDELGHRLVLMKLRLGQIERELREDQSAAREEASDLSHLIDRVIEDVRRLSRDLRPAVLEDLGLSAALRSLVDSCRRNSGTDIVSSIIHIDHLLSPSAQIVVYRIVQEAFTNAAKHAQATRVSFRVEQHGDVLSFVVEDNGRGFDVEQAVMTENSGRSVGLAAMHERARILGGSLLVCTGERKGTRVTLRVPAEHWAEEVLSGSL